MGDLDHVTFGGKTVDRRTAAMLQEAQRLAQGEDPSIKGFSLTQGSWSHVGASAGTHEGPGAFDMYTSGYSASQQEIIGLALRRVGFASWRRTPDQGAWGTHWHGIAMGTEGLPSVARQQVASYRRGDDGLRGDGRDDQPRPEHIRTWEQYLQDRGDDSGYGAASGEAYGIDPGRSLAQQDTDADGLTDAFEELAGTKVDRADSDKDGLSDAYEATVSHTDPLLLDTDRDGLADAAELAQGTDPGRLPGTAGVVGSGVFAEKVGLGTKDSDSDGLSDHWEELAGTDAHQVDSDADGMSDAQEAAIGTDPTRADSDHDGLTDALESAHGGDPLSSFVDARGRTVQTAPWTAERAYALRTGEDPDPGSPDLWAIPDGAQLGGPALLPGAGETDRDSDHDGLTDAFEALAGTDAQRADSDDDGLSDGAEAWPTADRGAGVAGVVGTGAVAQRAGDVRDADDDGLSDLREELLGSDGKEADTDHDRLADAVELALGTDPLKADTDGDGLSDGLEAQTGANPLAPGSTLGPTLDPVISTVPDELSHPVTDLLGDPDLP